MTDQYMALSQALANQRQNQASPMGQQQAGMPNPGMMGSLSYAGQNQPPGQAFGQAQGIGGGMGGGQGIGNPHEKMMPTMGIGPRLPTQQMSIKPMNIGAPNMGIPTRQPMQPMQSPMMAPPPALR